MTSIRNKFLALSLMAAATMPMSRPVLAGQPVLIDEIAAVVNSEVITRGELDQRVRIAIQQLNKQNIQLPPRSLLEKQLLERMVTEHALIQHAKDTGIRVDASQVERAIQRIADQNHITQEQLKASLEHDGVSFERFREDILNQIILARARDRDVENKINVTDSEIDNYLQSQSAIGANEEYELAQILVAVPENATPEQVQDKRARAQDILDQLSKGGNFAQLSASYSDSANALQGGNIGWRNAGQIPTQFIDEVRKLAPGQVSGLIKGASGFHIIKLLDKRNKNEQTIITQTHARHILIKPSELVSESDAIAKLTQIRERIVQGGATFEDMARQYSEDIGSGSKGGDLGWVNPGDTVPDFEHAMDALKPGEISQIIQTPFGWHIIQVLERRQQDITKERQRLLARQAIRERKADEAYEDWVRQIRDEAYVDIRLNTK